MRLLSSHWVGLHCFLRLVGTCICSAVGLFFCIFIFVQRFVSFLGISSIGFSGFLHQALLCPSRRAGCISKRWSLRRNSIALLSWPSAFCEERRRSSTAQKPTHNSSFSERGEKIPKKAHTTPFFFPFHMQPRRTIIIRDIVIVRVQQGFELPSRHQTTAVPLITNIIVITGTTITTPQRSGIAEERKNG